MINFVRRRFLFFNQNLIEMFTITYVVIAAVLLLIMYIAYYRILSFPSGGHKSGLTLFLPSTIALFIMIFGSNITHPKDVKLVNHAADKIRLYVSKKDKGVNYPEKYSLICNKGDEVFISKNTYYYFYNLWNGKEKENREIINTDNGIIIETEWNHDPGTSLIISRPVSYRNYMMNVYTLYDIHDVGVSNAIEHNLFIRPGVGIINNNNVVEPRQDLVLGINIEDSIQRKLNYIASLDEMFRPILLVWPNEENNKVSQQRNLWTSGKENEAVFCVGLDSIGNISWSGSFSWDNSRQLEMFVLSNVLKPGMKLDLDKYVLYLEKGYKNGYWESIKLENYNFLKRPLPQMIGFYLMAGVIVINIIAVVKIFWKRRKLKKKEE